MKGPTVCPATRLRCETVEVCWLIHCARGARMRPIRERDLTKAELYALHMHEQRAAEAVEKSDG